MFKQRLTLKLFLVFVATVALVVVLMLLLLRWSFQRGFIDYLNQSDASQITIVVERLEAHYADYGSWDALQQRPRLWREITRPTVTDESPSYDFDRPPPPMGEGPEGPFAHNNSRPPPPPGSRGFPGRPSNNNGPDNRPPLPANITTLAIGPRLTLFNQKQQHIFGRNLPFTQLNITPLKEGKRVIGWLGLKPLTAPSQSRDIAFLQQQSGNLYLIAMVALIIAALVSLLLARRLLLPIRALATGARALSQGEYSSQVTVHSGDELGQLANDFNQLANTLAANESARRRWIADISHELRTPLSVLRGEIEALQDGVRPITPNALHSLHCEVGQLSKLVDDLYQLSLSDLGALDYHKQRLDLSELIAQVCNSYQPRFDSAGITLAYTPANKPLWVMADAERIGQLLHNLLENTLRYTDSGGRIEITTLIDKQKIQLNLLDSAPGVDETALPHLFDALYRVESSRNRAKGGAGLGLAIVHNIVTAHQGHIEAKSSLLGGLWIRVTLPMANDTTGVSA
jgi:two-component system sensor histidine kinase BaeS